MKTHRHSGWHDDETIALKELALRFYRSEILPRRAEFEANQQVDRSIWNKAGALGLLGCSVPEEYGGGGGTFAHELAVVEAHYCVPETGWGNAVHTGIVIHYILRYGTDEQKERWLPALVSGDMVGAIAMTEPGAGSDLQSISAAAVLTGDYYELTGSKTFISNGIQADLVIVVCKTDPTEGARGISLICVETKNCQGFTRGKPLNKIGHHAADTAEMFFDRVRVPATFLLGGIEGKGFSQLMQQLPQERLLIGVGCAATMAVAVAEAVEYTKSRKAFGKPLFELQNTRFVLAEAATKAQAAQVFVDDCIVRHLKGELDLPTSAMCKWWLSEMQSEVVDACLQMYGGYGYMDEYPISRMYVDSRVQKIYGGANEVMKEIIARSL